MRFGMEWPIYFMEFLLNVHRIIDIVDNADLLNLFILGLNSEDVTETLYPYYYSERSRKTCFNGSKVNLVCENIRNCLIVLELEQVIPLFSCLLSTYVKMEPKQAADALLAIRLYGSKVKNGDEMRRKWLDYLTLLLPEENLFKAALSIYDIELAEIVVKNLQLDPKEFHEILSGFNSVGCRNYQRFLIDVWLGRYEAALENLSQLPERFDEAKDFIEQQQLYSASLKIYCGKDHYLDVCALCAKDLFRRNLYEEAGLLFMKSACYMDAMLCAELSGDWKGVLQIAKKAEMSDADLAVKLEKVTLLLEKKKKYGQCVELLLHLGRSEDRYRILKLLGQAGDWKGLRNYSTGDEELEKAAEEYVLNQKATWCQDCSNWANIWESQHLRLESLRKDKKMKLQKMSESDIMEFDDTGSELLTETSSVISEVSRVSSKTNVYSRNKKRRDKKKTILKVGGQYEDAALLNSLKKLAISANSRQEEIGPFLQTLVSLNFIEEASELQRSFAALLKKMKDSFPKIWPTYIESYHLLGPLSEIYRCDDGVIRYPEGGGMPPRLTLDDELYPPNINFSGSWMMEILKH
ncbi:unnamed protein product [Enterobius vermicularis]|uniref:Transducin family protein / WD-40 repeat family protein n=1 Tax=Enterobius vermicularis TaxID=51028 RepID=A0A0N4UWE6_ENTVE|nr:unnamed protein product [Enterobius vermicularis]